MSAVSILLLIALATLALWGLLLLLTAKRSEAGIPTSRLGRALRFGGATMKIGARALPQKLRLLVTPREKREQLRERQREESAQRVAETMGSMKGVMMKLGQIVSFMDEIVPPAFAESLRTLQAQAPPMDSAVSELVIAEELGNKPSLLFANYEADPMAAASIGQVHRAVLSDGRRVAVKVQYPGVDAAIAGDLSNAQGMARMISMVTPTLDGMALARELRERMLEELDYRKEAANQERFRSLWAGDPDLRIPAVVSELSSARVLTTELHEGLDFYSFVEQASPEAKQRAALAIHRFVFDSLWIHRVFNADPHPGNFLFTCDGAVICLDFGSVKEFPEEFIESMKNLTRYYLRGDKEAYYQQSRELGFILAGQERKASVDWLWDFVQWFHIPIAEDAPFTYTPEYTKKALQQVFGDNTRKVNMPPDYLMLNRITFGVNSLLAKLRASANWHQIALGHLGMKDGSGSVVDQ